MREIRRRSRVVGCLPDGNSALMLTAPRLRHIAGTRWGTRRYMNMSRLGEMQNENLAQAGWPDKSRHPHGGARAMNHDQTKDQHNQKCETSLTLPEAEDH
jgi:hypothetical protein